MEDPTLTMHDYVKPTLIGAEINSNTTQMVQQYVQFDVLQDEDPNAHLANFLEICDTFKINGVSDDAIRPRQMIDVVVGGTLNNKTPKVAQEFIKEMTLNNYQCEVTRAKTTKATSVYNLESVTILASQVEALGRKIDGLIIGKHVTPMMQCDVTGPGSLPSNTKTYPKEQVNTVSLRSGKVLAEPKKKLKQEVIEKDDGVEGSKRVKTNA
ncbi:pentatricopeptide repeat-containing protein chloroplastic-like [Gossypium australe]|uniref:Pentatricopeptide repeat-containing protein chloroplastic-like n=1 Tax=Gossypium australe TaxID=47621 RepID=A0A5B6VXL6_9ROSI|nr:pentatricopeptide repeat-containing protein chloroplastic-like [Gossypium australe]